LKCRNVKKAKTLAWAQIFFFLFLASAGLLGVSILVGGTTAQEGRPPVRPSVTNSTSETEIGLPVRQVWPGDASLLHVLCKAVNATVTKEGAKRNRYPVAIVIDNPDNDHEDKPFEDEDDPNEGITASPAKIMTTIREVFASNKLNKVLADTLSAKLGVPKK
jgi:hypothetical protein